MFFFFSLFTLMCFYEYLTLAVLAKPFWRITEKNKVFHIQYLYLSFVTDDRTSNSYYDRDRKSQYRHMDLIRMRSLNKSPLQSHSESDLWGLRARVKNNNKRKNDTCYFQRGDTDTCPDKYYNYEHYYMKLITCINEEYPFISSLNWCFPNILRHISEMCCRCPRNQLTTGWNVCIRQLEIILNKKKSTHKIRNSDRFWVNENVLISTKCNVCK